jgi:succinate dehydrogenase/fumarate reductase flavoprotein subunit
MVLSDYDLVGIGGGFVGAAATLSFLEAADKARRAGRVALIEVGYPGRWPGAWRWARPFLRLDRDNKLSRDCNENCERFHDEGADYLFATAETIAYDTWRNQNSYFITDQTVMNRFEGSWIHEQTNQPPEQSDTIAGLAEKLGLDPEKLEATVREFNAACGPGDWDPSRMDGKKTSGITPPKSNWANPITEAPFYGVPMTAHIMFTYGGLKVDIDERVLNTNEEPIPGLYAAGQITGLFYRRQQPETLVLRANTFGRIIGANVARSLPDTAAATS